MKKCPFCKAEIEDNARFCLYCMKPLNEKEVIQPPHKKKPWWPLAVAGVLLLALLIIILLIPRGQNTPQGETTGGESSFSTQTTGSQATESTDETTQYTQCEDDTLPVHTDTMSTPGTTDTNQTQEQKPNNVTSTPSESTKPTPSIEVEETTQTTPPSAETEKTTATTTPPMQPEETTPQTSASTQPDETTQETAGTETQPTAVVYTYRAARAGDDFNANYTNSGNDIVITGIAQQSADGIYDIPSYIDGKKVIAIVANAFSGSNARIVYVPDTVKTIWNYAFNGCALTDIYFRGNAIYVESRAFSGSLTIHCSANCSDRDFRYYKNCAASYGATWEEWSG